MVQASPDEDAWKELPKDLQYYKGKVFTWYEQANGVWGSDHATGAHLERGGQSNARAPSPDWPSIHEDDDDDDLDVGQHASTSANRAPSTDSPSHTMVRSVSARSKPSASSSSSNRYKPYRRAAPSSDDRADTKSMEEIAAALSRFNEIAETGNTMSQTQLPAQSAVALLVACEGYEALSEDDKATVLMYLHEEPAPRSVRTLLSLGRAQPKVSEKVFQTIVREALPVINESGGSHRHAAPAAGQYGWGHNVPQGAGPSTGEMFGTGGYWTQGSFQQPM